MVGKYEPPIEVLRFSAEYEAELNMAIANRMRRLGVPEGMIGIKGMPFEDSGAFVRTHAQGGANVKSGQRAGQGPGINVDLAVLDFGFSAMSAVPSWSIATLKDRIDAVIAHECTEALAPADVPAGIASHRYAVRHAPTTSLNITARARQILAECCQSMDHD
jgi:hypothetical protein